MRRAVASAAVLLAAAALAGCGASREEINRGGRIAGTTLNVYSLLPEPGKGAGRDMVDAEKLALYEARGTAGPFAVNFLSIDEGAPGGRDGAREAAVALRDAVADPQVIAMIGPAGSDTGRAAVPLLNAAGILEVAPGAGYPGFTDALGPGEPERWQPSGRITLARLVGDDSAQARAIVRAAAEATGAARRASPSSRSPGPYADALVDGAARRGRRDRGGPGPRRRVRLRGRGPGERRGGRGRARARSTRGAPVVLPDALTRAGVAERLSPAARRAGGARLRRPRARLDARAARASRRPSASASAARPARTRRSATRRCAPCWRRSPPRATAPARGRR